MTAACKAFSLANAKGKGANGLVIRSLDKDREKSEISEEEISKNLLGNLKP